VKGLILHVRAVLFQNVMCYLT